MKKAKRSQLVSIIRDVFLSSRQILSSNLFHTSLGVSAALLAGAVITSQADAATNLTFQQGANSYSGVLDTLIVSTNPTPANAAATAGIDGGASAFQDPSWSQGLFSFSNL